MAFLGVNGFVVIITGIFVNKAKFKSQYNVMKNLFESRLHCTAIKLYC